ncbi:MAG: hypothetical protein AAFO28_06095, partial [Pseudomonadota bacterium]
MTRLPIPDWAAEIDTAEFTDPALLKSRAAKFERTIKRRNILEYAAGGLAAVLFGAFAFGAAIYGEYVFSAAAVLCVGSILVVLWQLAKRGSFHSALPEQSCLDHLRTQYERQYEALRSVPLWYLGPIGLGLTGFYAAFAFRFAQVGGWHKALEGVAQPV